MDDGKRFRRDNKKTKMIKIYKSQEIVDSYDRQRPQGPRYIEEVFLEKIECTTFRASLLISMENEENERTNTYNFPSSGVQ